METQISDPVYREHLMDHYKNPRNRGRLENGETTRGENPSCGDDIEVFVEILSGKVEDVKFISEGCAISTASASMLSEKVKDKRVEDVLEMSKDDMDEIIGIDVSVSRVKCLMLGLKTLQAALRKGDEIVSTE